MAELKQVFPRKTVNFVVVYSWSCKELFVQVYAKLLCSSEFAEFFKLRDNDSARAQRSMGMGTWRDNSVCTLCVYVHTHKECARCPSPRLNIRHRNLSNG